MTVETKAGRTVHDIWMEVQREQKRFGQIMRVLVSLVFVAGGVAVTFAVNSYFNAQSFEKRSIEAIRDTQAAARVATAESKYQILQMTQQLLDVREEQQAQKLQAALVQQVDRAMASASGPSPTTIQQLAQRAAAEARARLLGGPLSDAGAYLINNVLSARDTGLDSDDILILEAAIADRQSERNPLELLQAVVEQGQSDGIKGLGYIALARHYWDQTADIGMGNDPNCPKVVDNVRSAEKKGVRSMTAYVWAGECLRKRGRIAEAFTNFAAAFALRAKDSDEKTLVKAANGLGNTIIARKAASELEGQDGVKAVEQIRPYLKGIDRNDPDASQLKTPLDAARMLLHYAADVRGKREGDVSRAYSMENVGFTHVLEHDWKQGLQHTADVDSVVSSPWNLVVRYICATELAKADKGDKADFDRIAEEARATLALFRYDWFDENELKKLLPDYSPTITMLVEPSKRRYERGESVRLAKADGADIANSQ